MPSVAIIEDDSECALSCELELGPAGWRCELFENAKSALEAAQSAEFPAFALMDLNLPGEDSFAAIAALKALRPEIEIVAFTGQGEDQYLFPALRAGATGYVLKNDAMGRLTEVLTQVQAGQAPMSPFIARRVLASLRGDSGIVPRDPASASQPPVAEPTLAPPPASSPESARLTGRELDVLGMLARGLSYDECAHALGISLDTVRTHVRNTYRKLHAASKAEAVAIAMRAGWLT